MGYAAAAKRNKFAFMKILCVDIGTGTQDIYLFDSRLDLENGYKLILPSPTMMVHQVLSHAARYKKSVVLHGVMMGGGPSGWGAEAVLRTGAKVFATPQAARTLDDDLEKVAALGVILLSDDELANLASDVLRVELSDFNFPAIRQTFAAYGVSLDEIDGVAVSVFDHGDAPPQISDRQFRFDYLNQRIREKNALSTFAFTRNNIPGIMSRLQAVAHSAAGTPGELILMDSAPAAVAGAMLDERVSTQPRKIIVNIGNFHSLAFRMSGEQIEGLFEHHTGLLSIDKLDHYLTGLFKGSLNRTEVFDDHGHGSLMYSQDPMPDTDADFDIVVTGPRRGIIRHSRYRSYFPAPFGDMMITGCFGMLRAAADLLPDFREEIMSALYRKESTGVAPWDLE